MYIGIIVLIQSVAVIIFMRACINRFKQLEDSTNDLNDLRMKINYLETEGWRVSYDNLMNADKIKDLEKKLFKIMIKEKT